MVNQILVLSSAGLENWDDAWRFINEVRARPYNTPWIEPLFAAPEANLHLRQGEFAAAEAWDARTPHTRYRAEQVQCPSVLGGSAWQRPM